MREQYFKKDDVNWYIAEFPDADAYTLANYAEMDYFPHQSNRKRWMDRVVGLFEDALSRPSGTIDDAEAEEVEDNSPQEPEVRGTLLAPEDYRDEATADTFLFTSAQANTYLNEPFWESLLTLAEDIGAELHVSRFTYNKARHGKNSVKPGSKKAADGDDLWYDPRIDPYVSDSALTITEDLVWCGELNILPTRAQPINGFENHGRGASVIIPHTRMAMKSIPTMKHDPTRFAYTTGTVTQRNYIEKAAGQKSSLHHVYGALLVEVDRETGVWWARQINADSDGVIYDLTNRYAGSEIERQVRPEILTHGDLHGFKVSIDALEASSEIVDALYPKAQVFHDTVDFMPRNHHNRNDPHFLHEVQTKGKTSVESEFDYIAEKIHQYLARPNTMHFIVTSNHDQAIESWLRDTSGFYDPENHRNWLDLNARCAWARDMGLKARPFAWLMLKSLDKASNLGFAVVDEDVSLKIVGIENGLHGHLGPNGARGNPMNLRTVGKATTGHTHSAGIVEGIYTAGVLGDLDMGYNKGLSSWSHSSVLTYPNGKRTILTIKNGKAWR